MNYIKVLLSALWSALAWAVSIEKVRAMGIDFAERKAEATPNRYDDFAVKLLKAADRIAKGQSIDMEIIDLFKEAAKLDSNQWNPDLVELIKETKAIELGDMNEGIQQLNVYLKEGMLDAG